MLDCICCASAFIIVYTGNGRLDNWQFVEMLLWTCLLWEMVSSSFYSWYLFDIWPITRRSIHHIRVIALQVVIIKNNETENEKMKLWKNTNMGSGEFKSRTSNHRRNIHTCVKKYKIKKHENMKNENISKN